MTWSRAELDALRKAYGSGTLRVTAATRRVELVDWFTLD